jgi:predicted kinase
MKNKDKNKKKHKKILAILIGIPGSGKTYYTQHTLFNYERISQDDMGKSYYRKFLQLLLDGKEHIVIDRANFSIEQRSRFIVPAKRFGYKITFYIFDAPYHILIKRLRERIKHPTINNKDYAKHKEILKFFSDNFEEPIPEEFDEIVEVKTG